MKKAIILAVTLTTALCTAAETSNNGGVNRANLDESIAPSEDFYQYACGGWQKLNPLQAQYARYGTFDALAQNNLEQIKELIQGLNSKPNEFGSMAQKVGDLYTMGMDSVRLNNEGAAPLKADLERIAATTKASLPGTMSWLHLGIASPFFDTSVMSDLKNSTTNILYLSPASIGLGDRDYYLENDEATVAIRKAYSDYLQKIFVLIGNKPAQAKKSAASVLKIETAIAKVLRTREESRNTELMYNPRTLDQVKKEYDAFDWDTYLSALNLKVDQMCVTDPKAMAAINTLMKSMSEKEMRDYITACYVRRASSYLSDDFVVANFDMFSRTLSGTKEMQPRWKRALAVPNRVLGEGVGQLYVEKYFPAEAKTRMLKLVNNLKIALGEHIAALQWMSDRTKVNALVKLNSFTVKIGYPDKWRDYSGITIDPKLSYWENVCAASIFEAKRTYGECGKPVDREEWGMTPQTVNAYYNPTTNEICFPAGILQAPYFDMNADDACNYGAIGVVIGHEMTHGFDDQGSHFDQNGNMLSWWTEEDASKFKSLTQVLVDQFNQIIVLGDTHANGQYTLGENIADQGGLRVAYTAFKKTEQGKTDTKIDGFTPDQRFYLAYANVWAANITDQEILRRTKMDVHSLGKWRVNGSLKNIDTFYKAFDITKGKMFLEPEKRVIIW